MEKYVLCISGDSYMFLYGEDDKGCYHQSIGEEDRLTYSKSMTWEILLKCAKDHEIIELFEGEAG